MQKKYKKLTLLGIQEVRQVVTALAALVVVACVSYVMGRVNYSADLKAQEESRVQESLDQESRDAKWESQWAARQEAESRAHSEAESRVAGGVRTSPFYIGTNDAGQDIYKRDYESGSGKSAEEPIEVDENCEPDYSLVTNAAQYNVYDGLVNFCYPVFIYSQVTQEHTEHIMDVYDATVFSNGDDNRLVMEFISASNLDYKENLKSMYKRVCDTYGFEPVITSQEIQSNGGYLYWEYESGTIVAKGTVKIYKNLVGIATVICPAPTDDEDAKYKDFYMELMTHMTTVGSTTGKALTWESYSEQ